MTAFALLALVAIATLVMGLTSATVGWVAAGVLRVKGLRFRKLVVVAGIGSLLAAGSLVLAWTFALDPQRVALIRNAGLVLSAITDGTVAMAGSRVSPWKRITVGESIFVPICCLTAVFGPWRVIWEFRPCSKSGT